MRVLILSPETPTYPGAGGQSRQHCLLEPLAGRHQIRVLSTGGPPRFGATPAGVDVRYIPAKPPRPIPPGSWLRRNVDHFLHGPPWVHYIGLHECDALVPEIPFHLDDFQPDVVQVEHGQLAPLLLALPPEMPKTLALIDLLVRNQQDILGPPRGWRGPLRPALEAIVTARQERKDLLTANPVIVVSDRDRRLARRLQPKATVRVVPNSIPVAYWQRSSPSADRPTVIMTATFFWPPNQAAALDLAKRVMPEVRRQVPDAELLLVGQGTPSWLESEFGGLEGVVATGQVDDVRPYLHRAWVSVLPLRRAGGSQIKVMEALAAGVPVVTTPPVAAALGVDEQDGVVVAGGIKGIATAVTRLLRDSDRRRSLSQLGEKTAKLRFDREPAALLQEEAWLEALSRVRQMNPAAGVAL